MTGGVAHGWTEARIAKAKKLWLEGASAAQIAKQLGGVTRNGVIGKMHRLGLSSTYSPQAPRAAVQNVVRQKPSEPKAYKPAAGGSAIYRGDPRTSPLQKKLANIAANEAARQAAIIIPLEVRPMTAVSESVADALPPERPHDGKVVPLERLTSRCCKWPVGDPRDPAFGFCARPKAAEAGVPYCDKHMRIAQPAGEAKKRQQLDKVLSRVVLKARA